MNNTELDNNTIDTLEAMEYAPVYHQWMLDEFSNHFGNVIVEVGAGTGSISKKLLESKPKKLFCIEPSRMVYDKLVESLDKYKAVNKTETEINPLNSFLCDAEETLKNQSVDTIIYINVLEHIENDVDELKIMNNCLSKDGKILIFVPALQWIYGTHDKNVGHFRRYYKSELRKKIETAGFEIVSIKYFDLFGILPWWFSFKVLKIKYLNNGQSKIYDKWIVPITRFVEKISPPIVGKNLIVVAKKIG